MMRKQESAKTGRRKAPPRAKLTPEMLLENRGVDLLMAELQNVAFEKPPEEKRMDAKDEEAIQARNLRLLLHKYEAWGRQLVPQLGFEEFVAGLERIAGRQDFRRRMPNLEAGLSFALDRKMDEARAEGMLIMPTRDADTEGYAVTPDDDDDDWIEFPKTKQASADGPATATTQTAPAQGTATGKQTTVETPMTPTTTPQLTEEQKRMIEQKRLRALELRKSKTKAQDKPATEQQQIQQQTQ